MKQKRYLWTALPDNPYRGLAAFREEDAPFYFGREKFIAQLVEAVYNRPLVPVIGASGSKGWVKCRFSFTLLSNLHVKTL